MDIKEIINSMTKVIGQLSDLLDCEKEFLIKDNAKEIVSIVEKKRELSKQIEGLEIQRRRGYGDKTSRELISLGVIGKDEIDNLEKLVDIVKEKSEVNSLLTKQSLNYIKTMGWILNPTMQNTTYGNNGKVSDNARTGVFTTSV